MKKDDSNIGVMNIIQLLKKINIIQLKNEQVSQKTKARKNHNSYPRKSYNKLTIVSIFLNCIM